jgi:hypothetical protein
MSLKKVAFILGFGIYKWKWEAGGSSESQANSRNALKLENCYGGSHFHYSRSLTSGCKIKVAYKPNGIHGLEDVADRSWLSCMD